MSADSPINLSGAPEASAVRFTERSVLHTLKEIAELAVPSIGSITLSYVHTVVVGLCVAALEDASLLAAYGLGSLVSNLVGFSIGYGLLSVLDTMVARAAGADNPGLATLELTRGRVVCLVIVLPCTLAMILSGRLLSMVGQDAHISELSQRYVSAASLGLLPSYLFSADSAYLRGFSITSPIFAVNLLVAVVGPIVSILLINGLGLGLTGAGLSIAMASWARFGLLQYYMQRNRSDAVMAAASSLARFSELAKNIFREPGLVEFVRLALPSAAIIWCGWWVYELQAIIAGWIGVNELAAHVVCCNIEVMMFMVPLGIQQAASVLVGNALGAGKSLLAMQYSQACVLVELVLSVSVCVLLITNRSFLASIYSIDPPVVSLLNTALIIVGVYHVLDSVNCVLEGVLRGLRLQMTAMKIKMLSMVVYQLPVAYLLSLRLRLDGIWYAAVSSLMITVWAFLTILIRQFEIILAE